MQAPPAVPAPAPRLILDLEGPAPTTEQPSWAGALGMALLVVVGGSVGLVVLAGVLVLVLFGGWQWWLLLAVLGGLLGLARSWYQAHRPAGPPPAAGLLLFAECVVLQTADGGQQVYPLDATTRVRLTYDGYRGELRGLGGPHRSGRSYHSGHANDIQFNDGPAYTLLMPDQETEEALRQQLRHWYARRVNLHEYRLGSRTVLLRAEPDYDEQMQLLRDYGFSLYGRRAPGPPRP